MLMCCGTEAAEPAEEATVSMQFVKVTVEAAPELEARGSCFIAEAKNTKLLKVLWFLQYQSYLKPFPVLIHCYFWRFLPSPGCLASEASWRPKMEVAVAEKERRTVGHGCPPNDGARSEGRYLC